MNIALDITLITSIFLETSIGISISIILFNGSLNNWNILLSSTTILLMDFNNGAADGATDGEDDRAVDRAVDGTADGEVDGASRLDIDNENGE